MEAILKVFWAPEYQQMVAKVRMEGGVHIDELCDWLKQEKKWCTLDELFAVVKFVPLSDLHLTSSSVFITHLTNLLKARKQFREYQYNKCNYHQEYKES